MTSKISTEDIQRYAELPDEEKFRCREIMAREKLSLGEAAKKVGEEFQKKLENTLKDILFCD